MSLELHPKLPSPGTVVLSGDPLGLRTHAFHGSLIAGVLVVSATLTACGSGGGNGGNPTMPAAPKVACADLARLNLIFEGNTTVTAATPVTGGTLVTPVNQTITNLPSFCRVQGVSKPTADSTIGFEV